MVRFKRAGERKWDEKEGDFKEWWSDDLPRTDKQSKVGQPARPRSGKIRQPVIPRRDLTETSTGERPLTFAEAKRILAIYVTNKVKVGEQKKVWDYVRAKIDEANPRAAPDPAGVRARLRDLALALPPGEHFFSNRFEAEVIIGELSRQVFDETD